MEITSMQSSLIIQSSIEKLIGLKHGNSICYSGYREGQDPRLGIFPSYAQVKEDLLLLAGNWSYLRLYDCSKHAETVLDVIEKEKLDFHIMLGVDMAAEVSNPNCPWGAYFSDEKLVENKCHNSDEIDRLIALAAQYPKSVFAVSVGNEASVEWTDHMVPVDSLVSYVQRIKATIVQPVTFCENYVPWTNKLAPLVEELDFISIHTYPVWEFQNIDNALEYTKSNYHQVLACHPDKPIVITEAGWTTQSNGQGIESWNASEALQTAYYSQLLEWTTKERILTFVFEAFDEPWKGSDDPQEPEKHWGLFKVDRKPKQVMQEA
ncbi:MAG: exo-beta-1,3-glucanase (GH17 family) [Paraglaciecola sp.]|jgi:exo-beta-1,3-glucanase (GH17 family)